jgi:ribosome modulation factor
MNTDKRVEYKEGFDAYVDGAMYEQCPYPPNTAQRTLWEDGWLDAETADVASIELEDGRY